VTDTVHGSGPQARTTYARAAAGYDSEFEQALAAALFDTIAAASSVTDRNGMDVPSRQREFAEQLARRFRRGLQQCSADPDFAQSVSAATPAEGHA
jgi:hypothetical protein